MLFILFILLNSCGNEKTIELANVKNTSIHEVADVSPVYLFYDETASDSVIFNRKNIIGSTNWLVNIDKKLSLKQILPHLQYLTNKRNKEGIHKNHAAKNYFTCHNLSTSNLGFVDFTETRFVKKNIAEIPADHPMYFMFFYNKEHIKITDSQGLDIVLNKKDLIDHIKRILKNNPTNKQIALFFHEDLSFQDYMTHKILLYSLEEDARKLVSNNEYILNLNSLN